MAFEVGSLWLPILDAGVVLRVTPPATTANSSAQGATPSATPQRVQ
jgi:hypothetical protein